MKVTSFLCLVAAASLVSAGRFTSAGQRPAVDFVPGAFIIEFQDGFDYPKSGIFLNIKIGLSFDIRHQYSIFNGMSIHVKSGHTGADLAAMEGVKRVWPVQIFQLPKLESSNENLVGPYSVPAHNKTGVKYVQEVLGLTGKGIKVGVIDTGVDYKHPAFGGCTGKPGPGCRVAFGWDFLGDNYDETGNPVEDDDPMDCNGHGTHVAGIIGADARNVEAPQPFVGVAPEVTFGAYRVVSCKGTGRFDVLLKAMERAAKDKMDIINMSLGYGSDYMSNPVAVLADKLTAQGVVVVAAAGNNGADGVWSVADSGLGAFSTSVASFGNTARDYYHFTYNGKDYPYLFSHGWGKLLDLPPSATLVPILKSDGSLSDGCTAESYDGHDVGGKVVLVYGDRSCKSGERGTAARIAGAAGMLIRSTPHGLNELSGTPDLPMASIEARTSTEILAAHQTNPANTFEWSTTETRFITEGDGEPSAFSSWGFDGDLHIKPDISGPGGNILSTFPLDMGSYQVESGTSMASPYIAGAYALLFNMTGGALPGQDARSRFINGAVPSHFFNHTKPAPVAKQGSGMINVKNTITAKSYFSTTRFPTTDRIELLDTVRFAGNIDVKITNVGDADIDYTLSHEPAESAISYRGGNTSPFSTPLLEDDEATVTFSMSNVTVPAGQSVTVNVQFQEPSSGLASEFPFYSGYIVASPQVRDAAPLRLPYAGIKGDVSKVPMLDTDAGFPKFAVYSKETGETKPVEEGHRIDWNTEQPLVQTRLGSHTPELSVRLHDEAGNFVGYWDTPTGIAASLYGRDKDLTEGGETLFQTTDWRGGKIYTDRNATAATDAATGKYRVVLAAQRKFSKGVYPEDFEVHELAVITL
ncbi:hypothetical protein BGX34_011306 [Mortierella sp. NVP85]|nr:hypothetical protein BGX34_011306 [Mortierella sp. NVP85]